MKILFVLDNYFPFIGGAETLFRNLAENLVKKGYDVTVLTNHPGGSAPGKETISGVTVRRYRFINRYFFSFLGVFPVLSYGRKHDLIQTATYNAALPAFLAGFLCRRPVYITVHEYWGSLWYTLPYFSKITLWTHRVFEKLLVNLPFTKFIAVSENTSNNLATAGIKKTDIVTIHNGIDYQIWKKPDTLPSPSPKNKNFQFLYFGRLGISKGLDLLLDAVNILRLKNSSFHLTLIISKKPKFLLRIIRNIIIDLELSERVTIRHHLSLQDLQKVIIDCDAVVIPSYQEGFCFTAVEAIALGKPVISSDQGALKEVVSGKFLKMQHFHANELANCMEKAMEEKWEESPVRYFDLGQSVDKYIQLYDWTKKSRP